MINAFLLIGQSNMAGRGKLTQMKPICHDAIFMYRNGEWITAEEPVHQDKPTLAGAGLCMSFASTLYEKYQKQIGLIPCAVGGTSMEEWARGKELYHHAVALSKQALASGCVIKGILWHQGEGNSGSPAASKIYERLFWQMIEGLEEELALPKQLPIVVGELGDYLETLDTCACYTQVNAVLHHIAENSGRVALVSAQGMQHGGDGLHLDTPSLREFGRRYAAAWDHCSRQNGVELE